MDPAVICRRGWNGPAFEAPAHQPDREIRFSAESDCPRLCYLIFFAIEYLSGAGRKINE